MDTKKGNKLIAEFMGLQEGWWLPSEKKQKQFWNPKTHSKVHYPSELRYNRSWAWLMPVIDKIESLDSANYSVVILRNDCVIYTWTEVNDCGVSSDVYVECYEEDADEPQDKLKATWKAVVAFLEKYEAVK